MNKHTVEMLHRLHDAGISTEDALQLRRIAMVLHRWHELECGDSNDYSSWCLVRGNKIDRVTFEYNDEGKPYLERHPHTGKTTYEPVPDRERGALKRLAKILAKYPGFQSYVQGDPREASLYILPPGCVEPGRDVSNCYNRGIAVYR